MQHCLRMWLHAAVAALLVSRALAKEQRASVCIAAERMAMAAVSVEQAVQHCLRVWLHTAVAALLVSWALATLVGRSARHRLQVS